MSLFMTMRDKIEEKERHDPYYMIGKYTNPISGKQITNETNIVKNTPRMLDHYLERQIGVDSFIYIYPFIETLAYYDKNHIYYMLKPYKIFDLQNTDLINDHFCLDKRLEFLYKELNEVASKENVVLVIPAPSKFIEKDIYENENDFNWATGEHKFPILYIDIESNLHYYNMNISHHANYKHILGKDMIRLINQELVKYNLYKKVDAVDIYNILLVINELNIYKSLHKVIKKIIRLHKTNYLPYKYMTKRNLLLIK